MVRWSQVLLVLSRHSLKFDLARGSHKDLERELAQSGHLDLDVCPVATEEFPQSMFGRAPEISRLIMQWIDEGCGDEYSATVVRESMQAGKSSVKVEDVFEDVAAQHGVELTDGRIRMSQVEDLVPVCCVQVAHQELAAPRCQVDRGLVGHAPTRVTATDLEHSTWAYGLKEVALSAAQLPAIARQKSPQQPAHSGRDHRLALSLRFRLTRTKGNEDVNAEERAPVEPGARTSPPLGQMAARAWCVQWFFTRLCGPGLRRRRRTSSAAHRTRGCTEGCRTGVVAGD